MSQKNDEVIAGEPAGHRVLGQVLFNQTGEPYDDIVTCGTIKGVVDQLQVIQIEVDQLMSVVLDRPAL